jgi:RNA polymerase sigma-70 factor (ECF subfamily)
VYLDPVSGDAVSLSVLWQNWARMAAPDSDTPSRLLVENHSRFLDFLRRRVENDAVGEDILQDAYAKSLERLDQVENEESVVARFYRILRNAVVDHYRRAGTANRAKMAPEHEPSFEPELRENVCTCVSPVLPTLKPEYAEIVGEVELGERSIAEVAAEKGLTANNATVRLHRARAALRRRLVEVCGTCSTHGCLDCTCRRAQ